MYAKLACCLPHPLLLALCSRGDGHVEVEGEVSPLWISGIYHLVYIYIYTVCMYFVSHIRECLVAGIYTIIIVVREAQVIVIFIVVSCTTQQNHAEG